MCEGKSILNKCLVVITKVRRLHRNSPIVVTFCGNITNGASWLVSPQICVHPTHVPRGSQYNQT
jgi:hypothetical protein